MRQSHLLKHQKARESVVERAAEQTITQYMVDMFIIALNDPEVMGKDVLGYKRLSKVVQAVQKYRDIFSGAMSHKTLRPTTIGRSWMSGCGASYRRNTSHRSWNGITGWMM